MAVLKVGRRCCFARVLLKFSGFSVHTPGVVTASLCNCYLTASPFSAKYPGGKAGDGVYQRLISLMPPHEVYIEPFLGGGAIMRHKRPARLNIGIDLDLQVINAWQYPIVKNGATSAGIVKSNDATFRIQVGDGLAFLQSYPFTGKELVYCDPPYMLSTRTGKQYRFEMTDDQHVKLLETIKALPCLVMISGYWTELYEKALKGWTTFIYEAMTQGGHTATEWVWMNYPNPIALHDYRYLGDNFRERERIKRKKNAGSGGFTPCRSLRGGHSLPPLERHGQGSHAGTDDTGHHRCF